MMPGLGLGDTSPPRRSTHLIVFGVGLLLAVVLRLVLLPTDGFRGDLDEFVKWVHGLVTQPFGRAYDQNLTFPPVMVYIWGLLAALEPAFRTVTDAADPVVRAVMKTPASLADLAIGLIVAWELRGRPRWAVAAGLGILLHPALIDVSAWWGQYESIYVLFGLIAYMLAVRGHSLPAAAVLALALMTKPQALPFLVPFAAWFLARGGVRGVALAGIVGAVVIALLWLPFVADGGVAGYARSLNEHQGETFAILSLRAWNVWWLFQEAFAGGQFVLDQTAVIGPFTFRHLGLLAAGPLELLVFLAVYRSPTRRTLALGLAAAVLVAFTFLTTMHERYVFGALVFLVLLIPERRMLALWLAFGVVLTLNLLAAIPPSEQIRALLPISGPLGVAGSVAMVAITLLVLRETVASAQERAPELPPPDRGSPAAAL
jgi:Gpi18-like mannosyltransferase